MNISIQNLCTSETNCILSLDLHLDDVTVLFDKEEILSPAILKCLVDKDFITEGSIFIEGFTQTEFYEKNIVMKTFGYVFDEGIMLSNLSIRENFLLPYRLRWGKIDIQEFENKLDYWLRLFHLSIDIMQRPAFIKPSHLKQLCYIRSFLLEPKILLLDNPYYLLNNFQRKQLFQILLSLKNTFPMLIASTDEDFTKTFADKVIYFQKNGSYITKSLPKNEKSLSLNNKFNH